MLRRFVGVALMASCMVGMALPSLATDPPPLPTPSNPFKGSDPICLLSKISFDFGLSLLPAFSYDVFEYQCSCIDWSKIGVDAHSPKLTVEHWDPNSHSEVWMNGVQVNTHDVGGVLTNTDPQSNALATSSNPFKEGMNLIQIMVGCEYKPTPCEYQYIIKCVKPPDQGGVVGDPQFVGLRGQSYQVHGVAGEVYNIVSDNDIQYNSRFVFLNRGDCPVVDGKKLPGCFSHPGSYLGELGLKTRAGDRIRIVAGGAADGFSLVELNGRPLEMGESVELADNLGRVARVNSHQAAVRIGVWDFEFENSDMFINQRVKVTDARDLRAHGLLGQTWRETTYPNPIKYVQGSVDDYVIRDGDIFGDNFLYNAFN